MNNLQLSWLFEEIADLLEIQGENPFKVRAYRRAARAIETLPTDVSELRENDKLRELDGIGQALEAKIEEWIDTGKISFLERLRASIDPGLLELLNIPGLGPKTVKLIHDQLGVKTIDELRAAAESKKIRRLKGLGVKTEQNILRGIDIMRAQQKAIPAGIALPIAESIRDTLVKLSGTSQVEIAGSLRRKKDTAGDIDLVAASSDPGPLMDVFVSMPLVSEVLSRGDRMSRVILRSGINADLKVVDTSEFGAALHHFTGSKEHNVKMRGLAKERGFSLSEYGLKRTGTGEIIAIASERELFERLGLQYIPPELREDRGEVEAAASGSLPELIELSDIRGDLHIHSNWSDGVSSIEEMAEEARRRGLQYIAVCDHSRSLGVAGGLSEQRLREQGEKIRELNSRLPDEFRVLHGSEVDILADGSLDYGDELSRPQFPSECSHYSV